MSARILIIDGHPDKDRARFCHALADAYVAGAREGGHETRLIVLADADFPLLRTASEFDQPPEAAAILSARDDIVWASHIVFVFPLWIGSAPALLRAFLEQTARGAFFAGTEGRGIQQRLKGRTARLIVTMGMPAFVYSLVFGAHGLKSIAKSALGFAGIGPTKMTLLGAAGEQGTALAQRRLRHVRSLGERGL
jgi:putative NADPH-quinone reductase